MRQRLPGIAFLVLFLLFASRVWAASEQDAQIFIRDLAQKAIDTVAAQNISDTERSDRFRRLFVSAFDIPEIGRFVLSRYWRAANSDQRKEFLKEFEDMQVLTWSKRFKDYHGERLEIVGASMQNDNTWLVDSEVVRPQSKPIPVQWRVRQSSNGGLKVVDIIPENVSMALTQRQDYASAMQSNGGSIDNLLVSMRDKNDQLAAAP
jgi:phospholipid transport system substrate-binding protein